MLTAAVVLLGSGSSWAFCRTMTCDPKVPGECEEIDGCFVGGEFLYWEGGCTSFAVQEDGSPLRGFDYETTRNLVLDAFDAWHRVDCGGSPASISVRQNLLPVECADPEYNADAGNANTWMYRDSDWPYLGVAVDLALTTVRYNPETGQIYDADVEINTFANDFALPGEREGYDLLDIMTHEAGHFLGLAHSPETDATMYFTPVRGQPMKSLSSDDGEGLCAAYPPDPERAECADYSPRHGFSPECAAEQSGCTVAWQSAQPPSGLWASVALAFTGLLLGRRLRFRSNRG